MKPLAIILSILVLSSCALTKQERRMNRATKKLEKLVKKYPELARTDTVRTIVPAIEIDSFAVVTIDTTKIDSLRKLIEDAASSGSVDRLIEYIPSICNISPIEIDNDSLYLNVWLKDGELEYTFKAKQRQVDTPVQKIQPKEYETPEKMRRKMANRFWIGVVIGMLGVFLIWVGVWRLRG